MGLESKLMRDLQPGDLVRLEFPFGERARIISGKAVVQNQYDRMGVQIGKTDAWLCVLQYLDGKHRGDRDYVIGNPDSRVILA